MLSELDQKIRDGIERTETALRDRLSEIFDEDITGDLTQWREMNADR